MHTGIEEEKGELRRLAAYFAARARGGTGLMVTGGIAPNRQGWLAPFRAKLTSGSEVKKHRVVTAAVHDEDGKICLQILHAGRYAMHPLLVAPSSLRSPISPFRPWEMSPRLIRATIADFGRTAALAREAGYDGVEIMGSEGYLINQFIAPRTNKRRDDWGGAFENRIRFPLEIMRAVREKAGPDFIVIFRISMLDLVDDGSTWDEVVALAQALEKAGASIINTGIGWHEARVPTIATMVPRGAYTWVSKRLKPLIGIPLITTNRINTPETAEAILAAGDADMVSMARPLLADPDFARKAFEKRADEINTCIACNQACLDQIFANKTASCLVNPRACKETILPAQPAQTSNFKLQTSNLPIAVVGAGPAGLSCATELAALGLEVHLFDASGAIGGQFNMAKKIPGKEEFAETLRYFGRLIEKTGVHLHLNTPVTAEALIAGGFREVVLATGIVPRTPAIEGIDHPKVLSYIDVLKGAPVGRRVAVVGAGGIGFDVAETLVHEGVSPTLDPGLWRAEWGVTAPWTDRGGLASQGPEPQPPAREVHLLQRKAEKPGRGLGKTTGWIHRASLAMKRVKMQGGINYERITAEGLWISHGPGREQPELLAVDAVVLCAGQEPERGLSAELDRRGIPHHRIGGADVASELDAKRAIDQAARLAARL